MRYVEIEFDSKLGSRLGLFASDYPTVPASKERIEEVDIPGRDGKLTIHTGCFEETEIPINFNYIGKEEMWAERWRAAKQWLSGRNTELSFGDDTEYYYRISRVVLEPNERASRRTGKFTAKFITKDGLSYLRVGQSEMDYTEICYNPGIFSKPIYKITGEGLCTLKVNNKTMIANVSGDITIDTELMIAYRSDGKSQNTAVVGNYEDLYLQEDENVISITDGFECKVVPRWRCR